ncbi:MAG: hypothetical protein JRM99_05295 [Nitrososphaerota archaeon]|nr:hypothetical protein [Nitrososphaerota archaeon]
MRRTAIYILAIATCARLVASLLQVAYGIHPIPGLFTVRVWDDFYYYYGGQLGSLGQGLIPYRDFGYSYTPLFLYLLYPFYAIGGIHAAAIPIVLADAATAPLVYLIVGKKAGGRVAALAGIGYALSPLMLFEEGYLWFSSQPVAFFMLLSVYLLYEDRLTPSWATFAVAFLVKQEAIFILPVYLLWGLKNDRRAVLKGAGAFVAIFFAFSLPFLILAPINYLGSISYGFLPNPVQFVTQATTGARANLTSVSSSTLQTLTITYPNPVLSFSINLIDWLSPLITVPLLILLLPAIFVLRRESGILEVASAYSIVAFLFAFSLLVHPLYRYYLVPAWALLYASPRSWLSWVVVVTGGALALLTPLGPFQSVLPLVTILVVIVALDSTEDRSPALSAEASLNPSPAAHTPN